MFDYISKSKGMSLRCALYSFYLRFYSAFLILNSLYAHFSLCANHFYCSDKNG